MNNKPDRTPQFYDAHTGYRSPLDHIPANWSRNAQKPTPSAPIRNTSSSIRTARLWVLTFAFIGTLAYSYFEDHFTAPPPRTQQQVFMQQEPYPYASGRTLHSVPNGEPFQVELHVPLSVQGDRYFMAGDVGRAAAIYLECAQQSGEDPHCQRRLAEMFRKGFAFPRNEVQADYWDKRASAPRTTQTPPVRPDTRGERLGQFIGLMRGAQMHDVQAQQQLGELMQRMSPEEREAAMKLWRETQIRAYNAGHTAR